MKILRDYAELLIERNSAGKSSSDAACEIKSQISERNGVALLSGFYLKPWEPCKVEKDFGIGTLASRFDNVFLLGFVNDLSPELIIVGRQSQPIRSW